MYFDGDPYNETNPFLNSAGDTGRQELLVKKLWTHTAFEPSSKMVVFDMVLYKG